MKPQYQRYLIFLVALMGSVGALYFLSNSERSINEDEAVASEKPILASKKVIAADTLFQPNATTATGTTAAYTNTDSSMVAEVEVTSLPVQAKTPTEPVIQPKPKANRPTQKIKPPPKRKKKPIAYAAMSFDSTSHDFGEITEGDVIKHKYTFTNTSNVPLDIISAKASCGCTQPSFPFISIEPGERNFIAVTYNSVNKSGPQNPEITIIANTNPSPIVLTMSGTVLKKEEEAENDDNPLDSISTEVKDSTSGKVKRIKKNAGTNIGIAKDSLK